jgi:hypothetical protein
MLDVLFLGVRASPVAWTSFIHFLVKKIGFFFSWEIFKNLAIKTLDLDPHLPKMPDPDPHLNLCELTSLIHTHRF